MATIRRGKRKGQTVTPHQWCNNWVTVDEDPQVYSPTSLQFTPDEVAAVRASTPDQVGSLLEEYELGDDGIFRRRRR